MPTLDKRNLNGKHAMLRWLGLGLLLGTGLGSIAWAQGAAKFDGQYMGELILTKEIVIAHAATLGWRVLRWA